MQKCKGFGPTPGGPARELPLLLTGVWDGMAAAGSCPQSPGPSSGHWEALRRLPIADLPVVVVVIPVVVVARGPAFQTPR